MIIKITDFMLISHKNGSTCYDKNTRRTGAVKQIRLVLQQTLISLSKSVGLRKETGRRVNAIIC